MLILSFTTNKIIISKYKYNIYFEGQPLKVINFYTSFQNIKIKLIKNRKKEKLNCGSWIPLFFNF